MESLDANRVRLIIAAFCVALGFWLLLFTERIQRGIISFHDLLRELNGPVLLIRLTGRHYEVPLRFLGAGLLLAGLGLGFVSVLEWEQRVEPDLIESNLRHWSGDRGEWCRRVLKGQ
jgi:hypothetical protein